MDKNIVNRPDIEEADDLGLSSGFDDFDGLHDVAQAAQDLRKRFILVCDATSSMGVWWNEAQTALKKAVDEIKHRTVVPFQVKVIAYRDHTYDSVPVEESEWSNDTNYLKDYISKIPCTGGGDLPESIGHGLAPAIQTDACMVILIGDAPGRRESTGYPEAKELGKQKCPVFALYTTTKDGTKEAFKRIASLSGGKAMHLRDAKSMTDIFAALLAKVVFQIEYQPTSIEAKKLVEGL